MELSVRQNKGLLKFFQWRGWTGMTAQWEQKKSFNQKFWTTHNIPKLVGLRVLYWITQASPICFIWELLGHWTTSLLKSRYLFWHSRSSLLLKNETLALKEIPVQLRQTHRALNRIKRIPFSPVSDGAVKTQLANHTRLGPCFVVLLAITLAKSNLWYL